MPDVRQETLARLHDVAPSLRDAGRAEAWVFGIARRTVADFEGHTQREVAQALGLSLSGAKPRVQRARTKLGEVLRRCREVEFGPDGRAVAFRRRRARGENDS